MLRARVKVLHMPGEGGRDSDARVPEASRERGKLRCSRFKGKEKKCSTCRQKEFMLRARGDGGGGGAGGGAGSGYANLDVGHGG